MPALDKARVSDCKLRVLAGAAEWDSAAPLHRSAGWGWVRLQCKQFNRLQLGMSMQENYRRGRTLRPGSSPPA